MSADTIPAGKPGSIGSVPEQVARLIRESDTLHFAERELARAKATLSAAERKVENAREQLRRRVDEVGGLALRAGWVTPELVAKVRP